MVLDETIELYRQKLAAFEETSDVSEKEVLSVLTARDRIQAALNDIPQKSDEQLLQIIELDTRLKQQAQKINQLTKLADWRTNLNVPVTSWWWFLQPPSHPLDNFDWLWNALTIASLTGSLSLVIDISTRFLSGGAGFLSSFAVISQSVLTLLTVGGVLTEAGRKGIEETFLRFGIKTYFWQETKFGLSALLLVSLIGFKASLPEIANYFNQRGLKHYHASEWDNAISDYERAISLDPDNAEVHHNLGKLYEQLRDVNKAQTEYRLAIRGNIAIAYSDLARLYLNENKPGEAISLLFKAKDVEPKLGQTISEDDNILMYEIRKNLGWARFEQKRYADSKALLEEAIAINDTINLNVIHPTRASAHCLLALVLEQADKPKTAPKTAQKKVPKTALVQWKLCNAYGNPRIPEEDRWMDMAPQNVKKGEE
ncbi:tetratricopeptide TPR_2 [Calothrix sp. NIES-2100]|uniref:tetratricopeptide repeat protein n=1 Tax=Calothrix sp. NIES-2100 TaxID=1954172 RepID=UPI000B5EA1BB|nr:tetratricopeptide TPR_2 [Calothrix sp. NIES-2100]